ncbi:MAG TPA: hypothetical protein VM344_02350 [Vitreimonas sp.]|jgi:hypothetical protein|nr:hypothetical protein [Vitreimonas sp.]
MRRRVVQLAMPLVAVAAFFAADRALAWNQLFPPGSDPNAAIPCTTFCVEWPKTSSNLSINVDVYLSSLLGQQEVDLRTDVRNTFPQWNGVAARNPHLQETTSTDNEEVWVTTDTFAYNVYAGTSHTFWTSNPDKIKAAQVFFNTGIVWNRAYDFHCQASGGPCWADARKVAMHEFGHVEALGHVPRDAAYNAVMKQGALTYHWPRGDDHNGIIAIYGAYP